MTRSDYTAEVNRFFYVLFSPSARLMMPPRDVVVEQAMAPEKDDE